MAQKAAVGCGLRGQTVRRLGKGLRFNDTGCVGGKRLIEAMRTLSPCRPQDKGQGRPKTSRFETDWLPGVGGFELGNVILSIHLKFHVNLSRASGSGIFARPLLTISDAVSKGVIQTDISEFESSHLRQPVRSNRATSARFRVRRAERRAMPVSWLSAKRLGMDYAAGKIAWFRGGDFSNPATTASSPSQ
jgi:hypothetical protein